MRIKSLQAIEITGLFRDLKKQVPGAYVGVRSQKQVPIERVSRQKAALVIT